MTSQKLPELPLSSPSIPSNPKSTRQERRRELLAALPAELQGKVSLHNVEAVLRLPPGAQQTLAQALSGGLTQVRQAILELQARPELELRALLDRCQSETDPPEPTPETPPAGSIIPDLTVQPDCAVLADLLQTCFDGLARPGAEALAEDAALAGPLGLMRARRECLAAPTFRSEINLAVVYAFLLETAALLDPLIRESPAYQQTLLRCRLPWPLFPVTDGSANRVPPPRPEPKGGPLCLNDWPAPG